jgi:hypothetical protein
MLFTEAVALFLLAGISGQKAMAQLPRHLQAQEKATERVQTQNVDSLLYEIFFEDDELNYIFNKKKNLHFLYFRTNYGSRTFYAGREIGVDQYNLFGQLYYFHSKGFYTGISGAWYSQLDPGYRTTTLSLGYSKGLKKTNIFSYRTSFNFFFFNNDDPDFEPDYNCSINAGFTLRNKWLGTRLDGSLLMGRETGAQLFWNAYSRIRLLKLNRHDRIQLEPQFGLFFGSETIYELNDMLTEESSDDLPVSYKDTFGLLNMQFEVPLNITWKGFDLEFSWIQNFPRSMDENISYPNTSYFEVGLGYILNL